MAQAETPLPGPRVAYGDRTATLRRLVPSDVDGLELLYRSLSPQDRYLRFFTETVPPRRTVERYVALLDPPGLGVVAVADDGTIVGEAGYARLAGGDGEFGITVAPDWRGLGSALLDSLTAQAALAGVPVLQGDVHAENRAMLGLAAKRGYALLHTSDLTVLRIAIGTATSVPAWPGGTPRPRLLVETPAWHWWAAPHAAGAGFHIVSCPGPSSFRHGRCPALHGGTCPLVEGADVVVVALPAGDRSRGAITPIHRFCHARVPVLFQEAAGEERPAWLPDGMPILPRNASPTEVVDALTAALRTRRPGHGSE